MGYRQATALTQMVALSAGYSAQVRALRADEEDTIQAIYLGAAKQRASVTTTAGGEVQTDAAVEFDSAARIRETLLRGIVSWTLDGEPGDDVDAAGMLKVTPANLKVLTGGDRNKLFVAINDLTEPPDTEEKKD